MKREKRKAADASPDDPSLAEQRAAGDCPLSTQDSALSTGCSALSTSSSLLSPESSVLDVFCPKCTYNLHGIESQRCPECGYSLAFLKVSESQIPWVHRKQIGRFRAYWRTVWWATFRRLKLGEELARPMSLPDARRFLWATMLHVYLAILILTELMVFEGPRDVNRVFVNHTARAAGVTLVIHFCLVLSFIVACRIGGDTVRNRHMPAARQAQALGLGWYAAGAFAWLPITWPLMFLAFQRMIVYERTWYVATAFAILGCVDFVLPGLLWIYNLAYVERCALHRSSAEHARAGVKQMLLLGVAEFVILIVLPLVIFYVMLIVYSLI